jgi:hypothetical protein
MRLPRETRAPLVTLGPVGINTDELCTIFDKDQAFRVVF